MPRGHPCGRPSTLFSRRPEIAVIYEDTAYGSSQADGLDKEAKRLGVEVGLKDAYPQGITDALPIIQKVRNSRAEEQNILMALGSIDRGYVIENGRIALTGSAEELKGNPAVKEAYLGL